MSNKRLLTSSGIISFATFSSRICGFIRDILIANLFGTGVAAQAFVVSFRLPHMLRDSVGEGASNAAFVPVLTEIYIKRPRDEFWKINSALFNIFALALISISICGILFAPFIIRVIAPGFMHDPVKLKLTINLTRIVFPFVFFIGIFAFGMSVLNSLNHFSTPAFGSMILNIAMILGLLYLVPLWNVYGLAFAVLIGGMAQLFLIGTVMYRKGFRLISPYNVNFEESNKLTIPIAKKIWRLLIPRFYGSAVYQTSVVIDNIFSSFDWIVGLGAPAALWYAYRLFHLPLGVFGVAMATASLPRMSREVAQRDIIAFRKTINFSLRSVFLILIPAGMGLAVLGRPIIRLLFERGEFGTYSTALTNTALFFYSFGLFACGGIKIMVNAFYAIGDTWTPVKTATFSFFINLILNSILMWPLKIGGLALATSIAAAFNFIALYIIATKKIGDIGTGLLINRFIKMFFSAIIMAVFAHVLFRQVEMLGPGFLPEVMLLVLTILTSIAIYLCMGFLLGLSEIKDFLKWILKRS